MRLISLGADINKITRMGSTPLHAAISIGEIEITEILLAAGADINFANRYGNTPLHLAVKCNQSSMVPFLVASGANLSAFNRENKTPLGIAVSDGNLSLVKNLIALGAKVNEENRAGIPLLHIAIDSENLDLIQVLLLKGANPNIPDPEGNTPLHKAVEMSHSPMIYLLRQLGASYEKPNNNGLTPLQMILNQTNTLYEKARRLYEANKKVHEDNIVRILAANANMAAARKPSGGFWHKVVPGAFPNFNFADFAGSSEVDELRQLVHALGLKGQCLTHIGSNCPSCWENFTKKYNTPTIVNNPISPYKQPLIPFCRSLHEAIQQDKLGVAKILANRTKDINQTDNQGRTPLHLAFNKGHLPLAIYLLRLGADPYLRDKQGLTPLHLAFQTHRLSWEHEPSLNLALEIPLTLMPLTNNTDFIPLHIAIERDDLSLCKNLLATGANLITTDPRGWTILHRAASKGNLRLVKYLVEKAGLTPACVDRQGRTLQVSKVDKNG